MYLKRFIELFVVYAISLMIALAVFVGGFDLVKQWVPLTLALIAGYLVLVVPLTALTLKKMTTRQKASGVQQATSELSQTLGQLPPYIALATVTPSGQVMNSIVTYAQDEQAENVFYVVTDPKTQRVVNIRAHRQVAVTTWFGDESGVRVSSCQAEATVTTGEEAIADLLQSAPVIKKLEPHWQDKAVLTIRLTSALVESFKTQAKAINFK
ncbi:pyridoxamine 5'-phosphate oxidase family protein [Weissella halotolerans]|uniref:Pyridoxamine 5'-phosphate oxidase N-terminal domain-containing protein n=1 Tax=Weissella halotolerans DSM 20190 TaxID=1123500 RepID=A0A0R2FY78_9LACO|nr:pyridoxamine 5'-phosphate oxidase family protein [Weissella halotolerans]KRN33407.1 hypothetical protein IV68_GL000205 [Weissella halotolerans DSM 20190]